MAEERNPREEREELSKKAGKTPRLRRLSFSFNTVAAAAGGFLLLGVQTYLGMDGGLSLGMGVTLCVAYLCYLLLLMLLRLLRPGGGREKENEEMFVASGGMTVLQKLPTPVVICRENGTVLWVNPALSALSEGKLRSGAGQQIRSCLREAGELLAGSDRPQKEVWLYGKPFLAYAYGLSVRGGRLRVLVFDSREELLSMRETLKKRNPLVCYIMIDNLDDVLRISSSGAHRLLASISEELNRFAEELNGVLQEIERDKYCLIFSEDRLAALRAERFAILDRVAAIRTDEKNPVTITASIGVSDAGGTLAEKEESAQAALNYALQDGGACAMVRGENGYVKYGGNKKAVQSSSKVRSRTEGEKLLQEIDRSKRVLVMGHKNADYDCFAACIGAARLALSRGVPTYVVLNRSNYNIARAIPIAEAIPEMRDMFVDAAEAQEKITTDTLLIIADVNNPELFEAPSLESFSERTAYVDHHRKTGEFRREPVLKYIDSNASSASELMCEMLEACLPKGTLSAAEAELLLSGIILDTKNFTVNAGPRTFGAAQYLKNLGADPKHVQSSLFSPAMEEMRRQSEFESHAVFYGNGIVIAVNRDENIEPQEDYIGAKAADHLLSVRGVQASFVLFRIGNSVRVKARSGGKINVQAIMTTLGGGGHFEAAAHTVENTELDDVEKRLKKAIDGYFENPVQAKAEAAG